MNNVNLIGWLGADPELKYFDTGMSKTTFRLAVKGWKQGEETTTWLNCLAFGKTGEAIADKLKKGSQVGVAGHIQNYEYKAKDGSTKKGLEVVASRITFVGYSNEEEF